MEKNLQNNSFQIKISDYTYQLDVILELIKKKKVEIIDINIFDLTQQYDEFLQSSIDVLPIDELANYLVMSSHLLMLKTKSLLLFDEGMDAKLSSFEEGADLINALIERAKYKKSANFLQDMFDQRLTMFEKVPEDYDDYALEEIPVGKLPKQISIVKLQNYFQNIIDEIIEQSYEKSDNLFRQDVEFVQYSIKEIQKQIINYLEKQLNKKDTLLNCFLNNLDNNFSRGYFSAFFLAILTLIKYSMITITEYDEECFIVQLEDNLDMKLIEMINEE